MLNAPPPEDTLPRPGHSPTRLGVLVLVGGLAGFLLWASFAPLDEGVAAPAAVTLDTRRKAVQHLSGGLVKEVQAREGEQVREGQVLMRLDAAVARAQFESSRQRYFSLLALEGRLEAEQAGLREIRWHPDLEKAAAADPVIRGHMQLQRQLLATRRAALQAELASLRESERGQEGMATAYNGMLESRRVQQGLIEDELTHTRALVFEGWAPRNRQLELERQLADALAVQTELRGQVVHARQSVLELQRKAEARAQDARREVETQRADVSRDVQAEAARFTALREDLARTEIRSPATGQVVGLAMQTPGGVITAGQHLMDVVPVDALLLLEAKVPPHVIDRVHAGLPVDIRFNAFAHTPTLVVPGTLVSVSADLLMEQQSQQGYYLARVMLTPEGRGRLGSRQMQPGMPAEVIIRTGERSLMAYLAGPLTRRLAAAMTEE